MAASGRGDPERVVRAHIAAFNTHDLETLIGCFSADATWVTGSDRFEGRQALRDLFAAAFSGLSPRLHLQNLVVQSDLVACELREDYSLDGVERTDHIAGFYRVDEGMIVAGKIYREGSADVA